MSQYRITNQVLGTSIIVDKLPAGVRVGVRDIGPSWNNRPPPKSIVEEIGTVRFWVWHLEGYVRLALRPGEVLHWHSGGYDEEGWSSLTRVWSLEGDELRLDEYTDGVDCDGRLSREWHYRCPVRHRDAHAGGMATPLWELAESGQRDYSAEAMGY